MDDETFCRGFDPYRAMADRPMTAIALSIAGSDSGGGAGIQADLKSFSALGVYGATAITALTAQNTLGVQAIHEVPADFVARQMASVLDDLEVGAIKIGMLANAAIITAVAEVLAGHRQIPVVLDPVMVASSGDRLLAPEAIGALRQHLLPIATLVTPNLPEAALLCDGPVAADEAAMVAQGRRLLDMGAAAVLVKGGHGEGPRSTDMLVTTAAVNRYTSARIATRNIHGTGCTLSAAIAAGLAKGLSLPDAIDQAKVYVTAAIGAAATLRIGGGHGPTHHFHAWWT